MKVFFALSLVLVSHAVAAQTDFGGATKAFALLQEPVGARPAAMGLAFEGVAQGSEGWSYNPAGPAFSEAWAVGINHDTWLAEAGRETAGVLSPAGEWGAVAARGNVVLYPTVDLRDSLGQRTGTFRAQDTGFGLAWAKTVVKNIGIGVSAQSLQQSLPGYNQSGYTWSGGILAQPGLGLALGAVLRDQPLQDSNGFRRGYNGALGVSWHSQSFFGGPLLGAVSVRLDPEAPAELSFGAEKPFSWARSRLALRGGWQTTFPGKGLENGSRFTVGAGVNFGILGFDYAFLPQASNAVIHQVTLTWNFGALDSGEATPPPASAAVPQAPQVLSAPPLPEPRAPTTGFRVLNDAYVRGQALQAQGKNAEAILAFTEAIRLDPQLAPAWKALGSIYEHNGRADWARQSYLEALKLDPSDMSLQIKLGRSTNP